MDGRKRNESGYVKTGPNIFLTRANVGSMTGRFSATDPGHYCGTLFRCLTQQDSLKGLSDGTLFERPDVLCVPFYQVTSLLGYLIIL